MELHSQEHAEIHVCQALTQAQLHFMGHSYRISATTTAGLEDSTFL